MQQANIINIMTNKYEPQQKYFLHAHEEVIKSRKFNYEECRIPVNTRMNLPFLRSWLTDYNDKRICAFWEYGFPLGANDFGSVLEDTNKNELWKFKTHKGAVDYPDEIV